MTPDPADNKVCEVSDCPGFGTAHGPEVQGPGDLPAPNTEQTIVATSTFDLFTSTKASDLKWWAGRLPPEAVVYVSNNGEALTAQWRL